jgi:hypothetical protein
MAYPNILYKGQYTLKRVLTMPADAALTIADIGKLVTLDATGNVVVAADGETFYGVLRTINVNDNVATVDFSGVHEFTASGAITPGQAVIVAGAEAVKAGAPGLTRTVALVAAADGEPVQVFFLN